MLDLKEQKPFSTKRRTFKGKKELESGPNSDSNFALKY